MLELVGSFKPRILSEKLCKEASDLCLPYVEIENGELRTLIGIELSIIETVVHLLKELGSESIKACLYSNECLKELLDSTAIVSELYERNMYFFAITFEDAKSAVELLRKLV